MIVSGSPLSVNRGVIMSSSIVCTSRSVFCLSAVIGPVPGPQLAGFGNPGEEVLHVYDASRRVDWLPSRRVAGREGAL